MGKFMEKQLRKQQNLLVESGKGVILFGIWTIVIVNMYLAMSSEFAQEWKAAIQIAQVDESLFTIGLWIFIRLVLVADILFRLYIGFSAVAEGEGRKKGYGYIVLCAAMFVFNVQSFWIMYGSGLGHITITNVMGLLMHAASLYVMVELLISGIRVKILKNKMKR